MYERSHCFKGEFRMVFGRKRQLGRQITEMSVGEKLKLTEKIEDKDLLLYLGLTNDANPLYLQHDFASQTEYEKPIVPAVMLTGIVTSAATKHLPGPGSHVIEQNLLFPKAVYHYETINIELEVTSLDETDNLAEISVNAVNEENELVIQGNLKVRPTKKIERLTSEAMKNFF